MRLIVLFAVIFVTSLAVVFIRDKILIKLYLEDDSETLVFAVGALSAVLSVVSLAASIVFLIRFGIVHSTYWQDQKRIEIDAERVSIEIAMQQNTSAIELASGVAKYNEMVLKGRYELKNKWFCDLTHPFWDDIPLIEIDPQ